MSAEPQHDEEQFLVTYTLFESVYPIKKIVREDVPWSELTSRIKSAATYIAKRDCPLISMGEYGDTIDERHKCLRYAENVRRVYGVEFDYDLEQVSIDAAATLLRDANIRAILYTSPSHTDTKPRWRVLLPFSEPALPEKRAEYLGRANRVLGGIASRESFTLSQSFYIGRVRGAPYEVRETHGRCIDVAADLEPQYYVGYRANVAGTDGATRFDSTTDAELRKCFVEKAGRYNAMEKLAARWATRGLAADDITATLIELLGDDHTNADGVDLRTRARPFAESAVRKFGETRKPKPEGIVSVKEKTETAPLILIPARTPMDWANLMVNIPPAQQWALRYWLPLIHPALLAGRGGVGKTLLAQHLSTAMVVGAEYVSEIDRSLKVLLWAGEDDHNELWRRQLPICKHFGVPMADLMERLFIQSYDGADITLAGAAFGALGPTLMLTELREQVHDYAIDYVFLDNIARVFGGNENDRHQVTVFLSWLKAACHPAGICLLGHPAKGTASEYSGSTAWEGAVRSRLYLSDRLPDAQADEDEPPNERIRYLSRRKSNYSANDWRRLDLVDGVLVAEKQHFIAAADVSGEFARDIIRRAVRQLAAMGLFGNASTRSAEYLPKLANQYSMLDRLSQKRFGAIMRDLIKDGELIIGTVGRYANRSPKPGLMLK